MNLRTFLYALLAAILWGIPPLIDKIALAKVSPMVAVSLRSLGITIVSLVIVAGMGQFSSLGRVPLQTALLIVAAGLIAGLFAQWAYFSALQHGEASTVASITAIFPAVTFILGAVILHEALTWTKAAGLAFVILGVILLRQ